MSQARLLANLIDSSGDIVSAALDNVPPSNDASALTTGTLDAARIAAGSLATSKITGLHAVATSGDYNGLSNLPSLFNGSYTSLTNRPANNFRAGDQKHGVTSSNRNLSGSFVNHLSVSAFNVPSGSMAACFMSMSLSSMYEGNAGGPTFRFHIQGPNNFYSPEHRGGRGSFNNFTSAESYVYFQHGFNPGNHTLHLQARTWQGNVTMNEDGGYDSLTCYWILYST